MLGIQGKSYTSRQCINIPVGYTVCRWFAGFLLNKNIYILLPSKFSGSCFL